MVKITEDELNEAYFKVNKFKINEYPTRNSIEVDIVRSPRLFFDDSNPVEEYISNIKLKFDLDNELGSKGSYVLTSKVEVIYND